MNTKETYAKLRSQLDDLIAWFDQENIDVDEAILKYEQAIKLTKELEKYLKSAENKIKKIK